ncbi:MULTISPECIES: type II toxin-antitoxin system MqsR family toxin [Chromobacterium]|uniref:type II toxin-antitoxin system MqsR family toxin n=1 Tax=Chromobacterium TaxID=535 RepID=UPI001889A1DE|nr:MULTISPECIES: type II toxin-antitoxin system MqsR family toxin [Chromobacterium]QOZ83175.1 type II toxin-antitoxin system MqsR family toxin [Chromobacterium sp. Rain0013]WON83271.1 type II toxin-antitoxin system MqsR family toxin [Chromobacterium haemolyticum]
MEKRTAHYSLDEIKAAVQARGVLCFTRTARTGFVELGLSEAEALAVVQLIGRRDFNKSMTTHLDHTVWQDVYKPITPCGRAYVKFTLRADGAIVISFKACEE